MSYLVKRWWQPALLLFLLFLISACRETATEVPDTPSPEASAPAEVVDARPSPTIKTESISTALPTVTYKGVQFVFDESTFGPLGPNEYHSPIPPGAFVPEPSFE